MTDEGLGLTTHLCSTQQFDRLMIVSELSLVMQALDLHNLSNCIVCKKQIIDDL